MKRLLALLLLLIALASPAWAGCGVEVLSVDSDCGPVQIVRHSGYRGAYPDYTKVPQTELLAWLEEKMPYSPADTGSNTYTRGPAHGEGDAAFQGAILVSDNLVVLVPRNSDYVGLYDPVANTYARGPAHGKGDAAFTSGVLLDTGKVLLLPNTSDCLGIYDPETNTYSDGPQGDTTDTTLFCGSLIPNRKVYVSGYTGAHGVYDPVTNTITTSTNGAGGNYDIGTQLHPSGNCWAVGFFTTAYVKYDYRLGVGVNARTTAFSHPGTVNPGGQLGGIGQALANDGKVVCAPYYANLYGWVDVGAATSSAAVAHGESSTFPFSGITKLMNGTFCLVPADSSYVGIYDSVLNTYTRGPAHGEGAFAFAGGVSVAGGKVVLAPANSDYVGIYTGHDSGMTTEELKNPWMNHGGF